MTNIYDLIYEVQLNLYTQFHIQTLINLKCQYFLEVAFTLTINKLFFLSLFLYQYSIIIVDTVFTLCYYSQSSKDLRYMDGMCEFHTNTTYFISGN